MIVHRRNRGPILAPARARATATISTRRSDPSPGHRAHGGRPRPGGDPRRIGVRRGLTPLSALAAEVDAIDEASLDRRLAIEGQPTELVGIRRKLNELLERLQMAFDRERRFSSGAAHELRTPIAELRALTEVALKWPAGPDPERTKDLSEAHAIACRMEEVVGALLAIARDGHVDELSAREDLEVRPIVEAAVASAAAIAEVKRVDVAIDVPAGLVVRSKRVPLA
jgi:signal transduction histidine kinase